MKETEYDLSETMIQWATLTFTPDWEDMLSRITCAPDGTVQYEYQAEVEQQVPSAPSQAAKKP